MLYSVEKVNAVIAGRLIANHRFSRVTRSIYEGIFHKFECFVGLGEQTPQRTHDGRVEKEQCRILMFGTRKKTRYRIMVFKETDATDALEASNSLEKDLNTFLS
jgi:hypothetical protein